MKWSDLLIGLFEVIILELHHHAGVVTLFTLSLGIILSLTQMSALKTTALVCGQPL